MRPYILACMLTLALAMAIVHNLALTNYWYWKYLWLDMPMHFAAGLVVGMAVWLALDRPRTILVVGIALAVGVLWEVFEYLAGVPYSKSFWLDTSIDLTMDMLGALVWCAMMLWWNKRSPSPLPAAPDA